MNWKFFVFFERGWCLITYMYTYTNVMVWVEMYHPYCANEMIYINMAAGIYQQPPILYKHMRLYCTEKEQTALYGNARMQFFFLSWGPKFAGGGFRCIFCLNLLGKIIWNFQGGREGGPDSRTPPPRSVHTSDNCINDWILF